ncbi:MAG TPA: hypothetical protein PKZ16_02820 [bacterium]|nr:hypothetical protein [bacterium]HPL95356.1 hypothetical protein [bacterium]
MLKKILFNFALAFLTFIFSQIIIVIDWRLNLWPALIAYLLMIFGLEKSFLWSLSAGFLFGLFSIFPFGLHLIIMYFVVTILYLLTKNFLTNRSFMSFVVLSIVSSLCFQGLIFLSEKTLVSFKLLDKILTFNFYDLFIYLMANIIFIIIAFLITLKFTRRLSASVIE